MTVLSMQECIVSVAIVDLDPVQIASGIRTSYAEVVIEGDLNGAAFAGCLYEV